MNVYNVNLVKVQNNKIIYQQNILSFLAIDTIQLIAKVEKFYNTNLIDEMIEFEHDKLLQYFTYKYWQDGKKTIETYYYTQISTVNPIIIT